MSEHAAPAGPAGKVTMQGADRPDAALAALAERAARAPEEPALFHPEGLDMRWRSWGALADQVAGGMAALRQAGIEDALPKVALAWRTHPDAVAAWLAVRSIGALPVPAVSADEAADAGCAAWLLQPGETLPALSDRDPSRSTRELPAVRLPDAAPPGGGRRSGAGVAERPAEEAGAACPDDDPASVRLVDEVASLARRIGRTLAGADAAGGALRSGEREIVLADLDLGRTGDEALLAWALITGAALVLEPDPRGVPATAAWGRPTVVAAGAHPLAELARRLRAREERPSAWGRWVRRLLGRSGSSRRPFGRLRLLVVLGEGRLPVDDVPFWADRGVAVLRALPHDGG